jgi:hypothetical protein
LSLTRKERTARIRLTAVSRTLDRADARNHDAGRVASGAATGALASLAYGLVLFPAWLTRNAPIPMSVEGCLYVLMLYGGVIVLAVLGQTIAGAFAGWFVHLRR